MEITYETLLKNFDLGIRINVKQNFENYSEIIFMSFSFKYTVEGGQTSSSVSETVSMIEWVSDPF